MLNREKVKIMTKLAMYEKSTGREDKEIMNYFKVDFISFNNFKTQVGVTIALLLIFGSETASIIMQNLPTITDYDFIGLGKKYLIIWIGVIILYTIISSLYHRGRYNLAKKRIDDYQSLLHKIEKFSK